MTTPMDSRVPGSSGPDEELTLSQIPIPHTSKRAFSLLAHLGVVTQGLQNLHHGVCPRHSEHSPIRHYNLSPSSSTFPVIPTVLKISSVHLLSPKDLYCLPTNHCSYHRVGYKMATPSSKQSLSSLLLPRTEQAPRAWCASQTAQGGNGRHSFPQPCYSSKTHDFPQEPNLCDIRV